MLFVFLPAWIFCAQVTIVRVDKNEIYFDTSELQTPVAKGDTFKVILSTEKLVNPKTQKELGEVNNYSQQGIITEVKELFAIGKLQDTSAVKTGMEAVLEKATAPAQETLVTPAEQPTSADVKKQIYDPIDKTIISLSSGPVTAPDADNLILLAEDDVSVWERTADRKLNLLLTYNLPKAKTPITISAVPVKDKNDLAQIFVSVYDENKKTVSTLVLENQQGQLTLVATLPYFIKELGCGADKKIWAQRPFIMADKPGNPREIIFKNGKYVLGKTDFDSKHNWLMGLNYAPIENKDAPNLIYTYAGGPLRMILNNGKRAESKDIFAASPLRVQHKQNILKFYPSLQVINKDGQPQIVAVENTAKLGLLSTTFGQYKNAVLHWLTYEKGRLQLKQEVELAGVVYDTACSNDFILAAEVLPDGTSSVVEISK